MSLKRLLFILSAACLAFAFTLETPPLAFAKIYQWKDDRGVVHFTDDLHKIPPKYRAPEHLGTIRELKRKSPSKQSQSMPGGRETIEGLGPPNAGEESLGEEGEEGGMGEKIRPVSPREISALLETIKFMERDIEKYEAFDIVLEDLPNFTILWDTIKGRLPEKKAFAEALSKFELPVLKKTHDFLKASIEKDENMLPLGHFLTTTYDRNRTMLERVKKELPQKRQLLGELKQVLGKAGSEMENESDN